MLENSTEISQALVRFFFPSPVEYFQTFLATQLL